MRITVVPTSELPLEPDSDDLFVTVGAGRAAFGIMRCPCGCRDLIHLRFTGTRRPRWRLANLDGPATVVPSIWRTKGCRSHFFLTDGEITWCRFGDRTWWPDSEA